MPAEKDSSRPEAQRTRKRKPLWKRKRLWALLLLVGLPGGAMVIATRTEALKGVVLSGVEKALGCEASATSVRLTWAGRIVVRELRSIAPDVEGPAAQILLAPRVVAEVDWASALGGTPELTGVTLVKPDVRVSQHVETGALNVTALRGGTGGVGTLELPRIEITDGQITLGEHSDMWYAPLTGSTLRVDGTGGQSPDDPDLFEYALNELDARGNLASGLTRISGTADLDAGTVEARLSALDLGDWSRRSLPSAYQPLWERMALRGKVPGANLTYSPADGLAFGLDVEGVTLNLPIALREAQGEKLVEMRAGTGSITLSAEGFGAELSGAIEDIDSVRIDLQADRFAADTPARLELTIDDYRLSSAPALEPIAPLIVPKILARFGAPQGIFDVDFLLTRGEPKQPGVASDWTYTGTSRISEGTASFEEFPYPIRNIEAEFAFTEEAFEIVSFEGDGATGGRLSATGRIAPPGDGAEVIVNVSVQGVPLDDTFREAMPDSRRPIFDVLFDREAYDELRKARLVRASDDRPNGATPFDLAGRADLDIRVYRPIGMDSRYSTEIGVRIAEAGIVPIAFPYPVIGRDIELEITPRLATVHSASLTGLTGMTGAISGTIAFPKGGEAMPDLRISARSTPIDRALRLALPEATVAGGASAREALTELGVTGVVRAEAHVRRDNSGRLGFEVNASLEDVASRDDEPLRLQNVTGELVITRDTFEAKDLAGTVGGSPFTGSVEIDFSRPLFGVEQRLEGTFDAEGIDLSAPFEDLASRFDEQAGARLERMRAELIPSGRADAQLTFSVTGSQEVEYALRIEPRSNVSLMVNNERWVAHQAAGMITATPEGARFQDFSAAIGVEGGERFSTTLDGLYVLNGGSGELDVRADAVRLASTTAQTLIASEFEQVPGVLDVLGIEDAVFDLETTLRWTDGEPESDWTLRPVAIDLERAGVRTETTSRGEVSGNAESVRVRGLELEAPAWTLRVEGERTSDGHGSFGVEIDATSITDSLYSLMPGRTSSALRGMELQVAESLTLRDATLTLAPEDGPNLAGTLGYAGLSGRIGVPIENAIGRATFDASEEAFEVELSIDELDMAGVGVTETTVLAVRHAAGEPLLIPTLRGRMHDGLLMGRGIVRTSEEPPTYEFSAELASVRFAGVLDDLGISDESDDSAPVDRGSMDAGVLMQGRLATQASRRGRITARVQGGRVLDLPGIIPLLELANLQAPSNERVDLAYLDLFIGEKTAHVDRLTLLSNSLRIAGIGEVDIPTLETDLAFSTNGQNYVPILSTLIEGLREELVSIRVTGPLSSPEFRTEQLRNTRALLDAIAGTPVPDANANATQPSPTGASDRPDG